MPLRVHCPNGCLIRLPSSRAGRIVRCSECKSTIKLPNVSKSESQSGKPIPIRAVAVERDETVDDSDSGPSGSEPNTESSEDEPNESQWTAVSVSPAKVDIASEKLEIAPQQDVPVFAATEMIDESNVDDSDDMSSGPDRPLSGNSAGGGLPDFSSIQLPATNFSFNDLAKSTETPQTGLTGDQQMSVEEFKLPGLSSENSNIAAQQKKDHKTLARFYGFCIATLGLISLVPAIIMLVKINQAEMSAVTPRWIYLLIFVGAIHLVYAVYLIQIADWSALWSVSIMMLLATCGYGVFSTAIMLDDGFGPVVQFLQLSVAQMRAAAIWCLIGLCFSVLTSYLCGRESLHWRRNEKLLLQIALQKAKKRRTARTQPIERTVYNS